MMMMMMNILALFLVLSSIGVRVLSPNPEKKNSRSRGEEANQKPITDDESSPSWVLAQFQINSLEMEQRGFQSVSSLVENTKECVTESFKKIPQRLAEKIQWEKEAIRVAKEKILEKTQNLSEGIGDVVKVKAKKTLSRGKWKVLDKAYYDLIKEAAEETVTDASERNGGVISKAKENIMEKTSTVEETIEEEEAKEKIPEKLNEAKAKNLELKGVSEETAMKAKEMVSDKAHLFKETAAGAKDTVSRKADEFKEAMKETATMGAPREEVSRGLFSKSKENILDKAHELEANSRENIKTATERANRFLVDFKHLYHMLEIGLTDDRTAKVKITHFLLEGSHNFTSLVLSVYHASDETVNWSVGVLHLMGFATAYGSCVWVTFVSSLVLSGALPRQQYEMVQSKIYPVYFRVMASTLGLSFLGHFFTRHHEKSSPSVKLHGYDLMASIGLVLVNLFFLEQATKVMHDIMKWEKEEVRAIAAEPSCVGGSRMVGEVEAEGFERLANGKLREADKAQHQAQLERLNKRLKKLNTLSAFCNILTLMVLTSHLASLSYCLYASC